MASASLLTVGNPKTEKGEASGYLTGVLHFAPFTLAGVGNVCPHATNGCVDACLNTAGRGGIFKAGASTNPIQEARKRRTRAFFADRAAFVSRLGADIVRLRDTATRKGLACAVRLNGTSDLAWHKLAPALFAIPGVRFYDYTKDASRVDAYLNGTLPAGYHLTFSANERTPVTSGLVSDMLARGGNVALVYGAPLTLETAAPRVGLWVNGDAHDLRFLDPRGSVALLKAKGRARRDATGFVYRGV